MKIETIFVPSKDAIEAMQNVLAKGAEKYEANGWLEGKSFDPKSNAASMVRHLMADSLGIEFDAETGLRHLEHLVARASMALYMRKNNLATFKKLTEHDHNTGQGI